jgi:vancomycin resistance protein VanJ
VAFAALLAAALLRLGIRDRIPLLAALFYATPPAVLCAGWLSVAAGAVWVRSTRLAGSAAASALWAASWTALTCTAPPAAAPRPGGEVSAALWNISRGDDLESVVRHIGEWNSDLVMLVEASGKRARELRARLHEALPRHVTAVDVDHVLVLVRDGSAATDVRETVLRGRNRITAASIAVAGRPLDLVMVDLGSNPLRSRQSPFAQLDALLEEPRTAPLLVAGDFNTPRESIFFDGWPARMQHAFETGGSGVHATWPMPVPLIAIDHAWLGRGLLPGRARLGWDWASDHRPLLFSFSFAP